MREEHRRNIPSARTINDRGTLMPSASDPPPLPAQLPSATFALSSVFPERGSNARVVMKQNSAAAPSR